MSRNASMSTDAWNNLAHLGELQAVVDPLDSVGFKNKVIDRIQWNSLKRALPKSGRLLDFGCGTGRFAGRISRLGLDYTGIDPALDMLRVGRANHPEHCTKFVHSEGLALPFCDGYFDVCMTAAVFQYVSNTPAGEAILREIRRVLKPGACVLLLEQATMTNRCSGTVSTASTEADYIRQLTFDFVVGSITTVRIATMSRLIAILSGTRCPKLLKDLVWRAVTNVEMVRARRASVDCLRKCAYYEVLISATARS